MLAHTAAAPPGGTAYTTAWCATATFSGANWIPVWNAVSVRTGSVIRHRYSSEPPPFYGAGM
nr:hypothetical protein [Streptomyces antibioticus]